MITYLDSAISNEGIATGAIQSFTPSAGDDRMLVAVIGFELNNADLANDLANTISWNGQAMTRIARQSVLDGNTGIANDIWILKEAGIQSGEASSGGFTSTTLSGSTVNNTGRWAATVLTLQGANQATDLSTRTATSTANTASTAMPHALAINTNAQDFVLFSATTTQPSDVTWAGATEASEYDVYGSFRMSVAHNDASVTEEITATVQAANGISLGTCMCALSFSPAVAAPARVISAAESNSTADTAHAGSTLTITVDDSAGVSSATIADLPMTDVAIASGTTVTAVVPVDIGLAAGVSANVVVNNGSLSNAYAVTFAERVGYTATVFTADHASLPTQSPFNIDDFSGLLTNDVCVYKTTVGGYTVSMSGNGIFTLTGAPEGTYDIDYYFRDASDIYNSSLTIETITVVGGDSILPVITLTGGNQTISQGDTWTEPGYSASDSNDGDLTGSVDVVGNAFNTGIVGAYTITYNVQDSAGNNAVERSRVVTVVAVDPGDTTPPVITLVGGNQTVLQSGTWTDPGYSAVDNIDGVLTGSVVVDSSSVNTNVLGSYVVTYDVSDAAGNVAETLTRTVTVSVDTGLPLITLVGSASVSFVAGSSYVEPGYAAADWVDGVITDSVVVSGDTVNPNVAGIYTVLYNVDDAAGNSAIEVSRVVTVTAIPVSVDGLTSAVAMSPSTSVGTYPISLVAGSKAQVYCYPRLTSRETLTLWRSGDGGSTYNIPVLMEGKQGNILLSTDSNTACLEGPGFFQIKKSVTGRATTIHVDT